MGLARNPDWRFAALEAMPRFVRRKVMSGRFEREVAVSGERELQMLSQLAPAGRLALDVGANIGLFSYVLSKLGYRVEAFEPNPYLARLIDGLGLEGVKVHAVAVSDKDGSAALNVPTCRGLHSRASLEKSVVNDCDSVVIEVPMVRLDDCSLEDVGFIKIDVEGLEEKVLHGAMDLIRRDRPVILVELEERHNPGTIERVGNLMVSLGYDGYFFRPDGRHPLADFTIDDQSGVDQLAQIGSTVERRHLAYVNNFIFEPVGTA